MQSGPVINTVNTVLSVVNVSVWQSASTLVNTTVTNTTDENTSKDREISSQKNFVHHLQRQKLNKKNIFFRRINGVSLYCQVVIAKKILPGENLTDELFYR